ncbi:uncharacterized protein LOC129292318 [Prosopis cineraria]|uniref:uncharacterized protein LOC129292318 n=1 Tax=Prosopis cineraria TaxID=364024 RepID=UPI0024101CF5|nr:uncharacterized protein LOC129292318 [Prosopis cineraria]
MHFLDATHQREATGSVKFVFSCGETEQHRKELSAKVTVTGQRITRVGYSFDATVIHVNSDSVNSPPSLLLPGLFSCNRDWMMIDEDERLKSKEEEMEKTGKRLWKMTMTPTQQSPLQVGSLYRRKRRDRVIEIMTTTTVHGSLSTSHRRPIEQGGKCRSHTSFFIKRKCQKMQIPHALHHPANEVKNAESENTSLASSGFQEFREGADIAYESHIGRIPCSGNSNTKKKTKKQKKKMEVQENMVDPIKAATDDETWDLIAAVVEFHSQGVKRLQKTEEEEQENGKLVCQMNSTHV